MVLGVDLSHLQTLFGEARKLSGESEFVVVGSLSVLGIVQGARDIPARMLMSIDVDCYTKADPGRIHELAQKLGAGSPFEAAHGYYLDPVSPDLPVLPDQWEHRLVRVPLENGVVIHFLDPNDAAVSKYARCEARDREWLRAGLKAGLLSAPIIQARFRQTPFLDDAERERAGKALAEDRDAG
ncbi:MAG: DUF6036 family nucleotidyltransferase [Betaproteobacteria bacterium]